MVPDFRGAEASALLNKLHGDRRLSGADLRAAYFLLVGADDGGYTKLTMRRLAELTGLNVDAARRSVVRLAEFGYFTVDFSRRASAPSKTLH
jgi:hypothetical protein